MLGAQSAVLNRTCANRAEYVSFCRFFNNERVDHHKIAGPLVGQTAEASAGRHVLVVQDTCELNYAHHSGFLDPGDADLGPTGNDRDIGFFVHPSIAIDRERQLLLGAGDVHIWNRRFGKPDKTASKYKGQPIEEKESYRWISSAERSKRALAGASSILFVADREADIYEEFVRVPDGRCHVLVRSRADRNLYGGGKLYGHIRSQPVAGKVSLTVRKAANRKQRDATLHVRYATAKVLRPESSDKALPAYVELNAVMASEEAGAAPKGERPVSWVLLTTCPVDSLADALEMVRCYALRWQAELVFASLKSKGVDVESSELETGRALKSMAAMSLVTALRVNQLRLARDDRSGTPAGIIFTAPQIKLLGLLVKQLEGATEKQKNPHKRGCLAWAAWAVARLGGWKGYSSESPPGNKTMYHGWKRFAQVYEGWDLAQIKQ